MLIRYIFLFVAAFAFAPDSLNAQACVCTNCPQFMQDLFVGDFNINIQGATNPTLGQNGQAVCAVKVHFNHTALCDISITLTSPSGQTITLVGPIGQFCTNMGNTGTDWDVTFLPCGGGAMPDPGFAAQWNNNQPWGANNNYTGSYFPFAGCLQNFTGPVNGNWTLTVTDGQALDTGNLFDYEIIFCDPSGITCVSCVADAGALLQDDVEECQGDPNLILSLPPTYQSPASPPPSAEYSYGYVISGNGGVILDIADVPDLSSLPAGNYSVCGISYLTAHENLLPVINGVLTVTQLTNQLISNTPPFCGNISTNCVGVTINPIPPDVEEIAVICSPNCYDFLGSFYCQTGDYPVDQMDANGCHYNAVLRLTVNAPSSKALTETVCPGTCSSNPNFPTACSSGLYQVVLMNAVGCDSLLSLNLTVLNIDAVIQPPPVLSCAQPTAQLSGTGSTTGSGTTYLWTASNGGSISGANNLINVTAAAPGTYRLVVCRTIAGASCCDTANVTVTSSSSLPNTPGIIGDTLICVGINQQYSVNADPNANSYTWTVPSGVQIISGQGDSSIVVQWNNNMGGDICVTADNICGSSQANCISLQVTSAPPAPTVSGLTPVCKDSIVSYFVAPIAGVSSFDWQVVGGTLLSGQGTDTIQVRWDSLQTSGSVCASANNTCGQGGQNCLLVNINSVPGLAQIQGDSLLCVGDTATYSFPALSTATGYSWTVPAGATLLSAQANNTVLVLLWTAAPGGNVCVQASNGCGTGLQQCFPVTVLAQPAANAGLDTSFCGISVNLSAANSVMGSTGLWTSISGPGSASFSNDSLINSLVGVDSNGVYQFQWIETNGICSDPDTVQVAFNAAPQGGTKQIACDGTNQNYTITFSVTGGAAPYTIPGGNITNGIFISDPIPNGQSYAFSITDSNACVSTAITGVFNCNCATNAGSMNQQPLTACPGNSVAAQAAQGSNLDADDVGAFVLHTGSGSSLGTILGENTTGVFSFANGMVYGTTYYISFVVGNNLIGLPDLTDPCLSVAPGQPVIFYDNPVANAGQDISTCGLGLQVLGNAPAGTVLWSVTGTPAGANAAIASPQNTSSTITASTFGTYTLTFTVTDNGCMSTDAVQVNFNDSPVANMPILTCDGTNQQFTVSFDISAGLAPYSVNGQAIAGTSFTSAPFPSGSSYTLVITDGNGCTSANISGTFACNCATNAGQVSQTPITVCQSDSISVQFLGGQTLDADDVFAYVLHTGSGAALGTVLAQNVLGKFGFGANLSFGTTYYISTVAGNNLNGFPDPNDPCFSVSPGQPVVFLQNPVPNAGADIAICGLTTNMAAISGLFPGIWTQVSGPNTANFSNNQSPSSNILVPDAGSYVFRWTQTNGICTGFDEVKVDFRSNPSVTALIPTCNATNTGYTLSFTVQNGSPNYSTTGLNGTFSGNTFNSALLPNNSSYSFVVNDAFGCPSPAITGSFVCNCATNAGTMDPNPLLFCANTAATVVWNNDATLDGDDAVLFILHDQAGPSLGTVFATNAQPIFFIGPGLQIGVTYYISAIAGNSTPSGIDTGDPCFSIAPGTPFQWKPKPTATISGDASICRGSSTVLNISGTGIFPLNLTYDDGNGFMPWVIQNPQSTPITVSPLATTTYTLIVVDDGSLPTCSSFLNSSVTVTVNQPVNAGIALPPEVLCAGQSKLISLSSLLSGADAGGVWSETSANPSGSGAFNANSGSFNTNGQLAGTYTFRYALQATAPCQSQSTTVTVTIHPSPVADAGPDQLLDCFQDMATLGGPGTTQGTGIQYSWTRGGVEIGTQAQLTAEQAGAYTLLVNNAFGCTHTDLVNIIVDNDIPNAGMIQISDISCHGEQDGAIQLDAIQSNHPPVLFSLNGGAYGPNPYFQGLSAGTYTITLQDDKGCTWTTPPQIVTEPAALTVDLGTEVIVTFGDSVFLEANASVPLSALASLQWNPVLDSLRAQTFTQRFLPFTSKSITLSLIDTFGCEAIARVLVKVKRPEEVFIPNIFHPGSELNDRLTVFGGPGVAEIESFRIFDRWGEQLFNVLNFQPNDPSLGWDGAYRGEAVLPGVYVYFAVVRFIDGKTEVYRGDVTVLR
jgi:subtilisin-like proprotein convertase family protein